MRHTGLGILALIVGLALVPTAGAAQSVIGQPDIDVVAPNNRVMPGEEVALEVTVLNDGQIERGGPAQYEQRVKTARGATVELRSGSAPVTVKTGPVPVGSIPEGSAGPLTFRVAVSDDAEPGRYRLPVEVSYAYTRHVEYGPRRSPKYHDFSRERQLELTLVVDDRARFRVVNTGTTAQIGETGDLTVSLENVGSEPARDASVTLTSRDNALTIGSAPGGSSGYVGSWRPGEVEDVEYGIMIGEDAEARGFTLGAEVAFDDTDGIRRRSRQLPLGVTPGREQEFGLLNVTADLAVGNEGSIEGTVVNEGPAAVRNPSITLTSENPSISVSESQYALPDLAVGDAASFDFDVDVSDEASAGYRRLPFRVRYEDEDGDVQPGDRISHRFRVASKRDDFRVRARDNEVAAGGSGSLVLAISNDRDEVVRDVSAKAFVDDPLSSNDDEGYIARLEPNETAEVAIGVGVAPSALTKTYPVSIDFQYTDSDGNTRLSDTYKVAVDVTEQSGGGLPIGPIVALIVIAGGLVYWFRFR